MSNTETADDELRQVDLSHLQLSEMSTAQRAEIRRRYADFIKRLAKPQAPRTMATPTQSSTKWMPGKKVSR